MNNNIYRLHLVDTYRGLLIVFMVFFHFFFALNYFYGLEFSFLYAAWFELLADFVRFGFIFLVGITSRILYEQSSSYNVYVRKQLKRLWPVLLSALVITIFSLIFIDAFIFWGILHLISFLVISLILVPKKLYFTLFWILMLCLSMFYDEVLLVTGFGTLKSETLDFFPLFPWLICGYIGYYSFALVKPYLEKYNRFRFNRLEFIGRYSLLIYMMHMPLLWPVIMFIGKTLG